MPGLNFLRIAAVAPELKVADCHYNAAKIIDAIHRARKEGASIAVFPEMCITAYTCQDLFFQKTLLNSALDALNKILTETAKENIVAIVGLPLEIGNSLYNVAAVVSGGQIVGAVPKTYLPNYSEFYDKRWFSSGSNLKHNRIEMLNQSVPAGADLIFETPTCRFAIELCEDLWTAIPPSSKHALNGADLIFNLSASPETTGKHHYRKNLVLQQSARCIAAYAYAGAGPCESTTDLVFGGACLITENGELLAESKRFEFETQIITADVDIEQIRHDRLLNKSFADCAAMQSIDSQTVVIDSIQDEQLPLSAIRRKINPTPFVPSSASLDERCSEIFSIQTAGLAKRLLHTGLQHTVVGVSGGLDSTLALLVMVKTYDKLGYDRALIHGITMPGPGTTTRTYNNALQLMQALGLTAKEIPITDAVLQHFADIGQSPEDHDITYENCQARERTQILMDYANKIGAMVIGTGDLSELALGWCTFNGDHMSMYAVNTGIPKTLVKTLVQWVARTQLNDTAGALLSDIVATPVSPELLPADAQGNIAQKTEDVVGPYILHDFFLYYMLRHAFSPAKIMALAQLAFAQTFEQEEILKWLKVFYRRFFSQQFKRSCIPDGPKIGSINLSPRGDWRMPSDASAALWLNELEQMNIQ